MQIILYCVRFCRYKYVFEYTNAVIYTFIRLLYISYYIYIFFWFQVSNVAGNVAGKVGNVFGGLSKGIGGITGKFGGGGFF